MDVLCIHVKAYATVYNVEEVILASGAQFASNSTSTICDLITEYLVSDIDVELKDYLLESSYCSNF